MPKLELVSVAENDYSSDRITAKQESHIPNRQTLRVSITSNNNLVLETWCPGFRGGRDKLKELVIYDIDIEGMLQFLQDAKTFVEEERMIKKLIRRK